MAAEAAAHAAAGLRAVKTVRVKVVKAEPVPASQGAGVGRWLRLAREVGWPEGDLATLGRIIAAESGGNPLATNGQYRGLLQFSAYWYADYWSFDPYDPRQALTYGLKLKRLCGWSSWSTY